MFQIDLLMSMDALYKFIDRAYLPPQLGGGRTLSHITWANFRQVSVARPGLISDHRLPGVGVGGGDDTTHYTASGG